MNMELLTASLHAGLIQRARPAKVVPLRDDQAAGRAAVVPLRASDIARAGQAASPLPRAEWPARAVRAEVAAGSTQIGMQTGTQPGAPVGGASPARRFGLTVRVHEELREMLADSRARSGRTTQSILHDALVDYLARRRRADR